ncbi:MAG: DUF6644 family protein [Vicinamibacterales bacterium]
MLLRLFETVQAMPSSMAIRESIYLYPAIESVHVLSTCLFLGLVTMMDLRLVSATLRSAPLTDVQHRLFPWQMAGFALMVMSGVLLVFTEPLRFYSNIFFQVKMLLLLLAGLNMLVFHAGVYRRVAEWDHQEVLPGSARVAGALSMVLFSGIVVCGRMIAYNWFK